MPRDTDWRESIPALDDVYVFQAALYCEDCGNAIQDTIRKEGEAPENEDDEESFDSDDFPKGPYGNGGGEADSVHHCDSHEKCLNAIKLPCGSKVGAWLGNPLTHDGVDWLVNSITEDLLASKISPQPQQVGRLWAYLYQDQLSGRDCLGQLEHKALEAPLVLAFIRMVAKHNDHAINRVMLDLNNIYGFSSKGSVMSVWRSEVQPDGRLGLPAYVHLPLGEASEREPMDILRELIEAGAWD
jgi:hypothetical protein